MRTKIEARVTRIERIATRTGIGAVTGVLICSVAMPKAELETNLAERYAKQSDMPGVIVLPERRPTPTAGETQ